MKKISWAFNEKNMPVLAVHARKEDGPFHCHCGKQHPVHLSKPSGDPDKRIFQAYFAHNNVLGVNGDHFGPCSRGGESREHCLAKVLLQVLQGRYLFGLEECKCGSMKREYCEGGEMHLEFRDMKDKWVYDCCLVRDGVPCLALEVKNTHATTVEKLRSVQNKQLPLAEFHCNDILKLLDLSDNPNQRLFLNNLQMAQVVCSDCQRRNLLEIEQDRLNHLRKIKEEAEQRERERVQAVQAEQRAKQARVWEEQRAKQRQAQQASASEEQRAKQRKDQLDRETKEEEERKRKIPSLNQLLRDTQKPLGKPVKMCRPPTLKQMEKPKFTFGETHGYYKRPNGTIYYLTKDGLKQERGTMVYHI